MPDTTQQPTTTAIVPSLSITPEMIRDLVGYLQKGHEVAVSNLKLIQSIPFDPNNTDVGKKEREAVADTLAKAKKIYDAMSTRRKVLTDPIKSVIEQIMSYENDINYNSKTNNEFHRARAVLEAYDQQVLDAKKVAEVQAEFNRKVAVYKAELKAAVQRRLLEMMTGQEKNLRQGMINWEGSLTVENIDQKEKSLRDANLKLNPEKYNACFHTDFPMNTHLLSKEDTVKLIESFKAEFTYEKTNEEYMLMAGPIKNEYLAKLPDVKEKLIKSAGDAKAEEQRKLELKKQEQVELDKINQQALAKGDEITNQAELSKMEASFVMQGTLSDSEAGPSKKVASFTDDKAWLAPLLNVIGQCALHPKFPGIFKKSGGEYIDAVGWWMKFFGQYCPDKDVKGITLTDVAKTIVKESKK